MVAKLQGYPMKIIWLLLFTRDGEVIEPVAIRESPLNGRMQIDLVLTLPGAHLSHGAQAGDMNPLYWRPGQRSAMSIGGNRPNANYFLLDGATNTDPTFNTLRSITRIWARPDGS